MYNNVILPKSLSEKEYNRRLTSLEDSGWVKGALEGVVISLIRSMVLTISLLVWIWKGNWNSEFILLCWLWLRANGYTWQIRSSLMATVPPPQTSPGPSCWPLHWQWLGLGSADGICQGWLASKFHHLEWAEEEKRISKKHLRALESFLVRSLKGTGHQLFAEKSSGHMVQCLHKFSLTSNRFSTNFQSFLFYILILLQYPQISLTPPLSFSAEDFASWEKTEAIRPELIQVCAYSPYLFF